MIGEIASTTPASSTPASATAAAPVQGAPAGAFDNAMEQAGHTQAQDRSRPSSASEESADGREASERRVRAEFPQRHRHTPASGSQAGTPGAAGSDAIGSDEGIGGGDPGSNDTKGTKGAKGAKGTPDATDTADATGEADTSPEGTALALAMLDAIAAVRRSDTPASAEESRSASRTGAAASAAPTAFVASRRGGAAPDQTRLDTRAASATGTPASAATQASPGDPGQTDASTDPGAAIGDDSDQGGTSHARATAGTREEAEARKDGAQPRAQAGTGREDRSISPPTRADDDGRPDPATIAPPDRASTPASSLHHDELARVSGIVDPSATPIHRAAAAPETLLGTFTPLRGFVAEPPGSAGFGPAFAGEIDRLLLQGTQSAEILLTPRSLGPIRIELSMTGETASVAFSATQPETRQAIEQSLPLLRSLLAEHGLQLGQTEVGSHEHRQGDQLPAQSQAGAVRDHGPTELVPRPAPGRPSAGSRLLDLFA